MTQNPNIITSAMEWNGRNLSIEVGKIARKASSAIVKYGKTTMLVAVTASKIAGMFAGEGGAALMVNFASRYYATGSIPGGFFKRESKPSEREILASRIIDRSLRPLISADLLNEINVNCTLLSYESGCMPEVPALIGASVALMNMKVPFSGPVVGINTHIINNEIVFAPHTSEISNSILDLFISCTKSSVVMLEAEAKEVSEDNMNHAIQAGYSNIEPILEFVNDFVNKCSSNDDEGHQPVEWLFNKNEALKKQIAERCATKLRGIYSQQLPKAKRMATIQELYQPILAELVEAGFEETAVKYGFKSIESDTVRDIILKDNVRIDGRSNTEIRKIESEVNILDQVHGSALFTRGGTQSLAVVTLGSFQDGQAVDDFDGERKEHFMLHYNFPAYSVGEIGLAKPPGRREIGHGRLALKAISAVLPEKDVFPYTMRVVSEITESDGSSSMATVCATSLAMMDTGIPITKPVAGIAMGLIQEGEQSVILSDILGDEDSLGDMDFKVAGTEDGITALQLDIKIDGISHNAIQGILQQALAGRLHILDCMKQTINTSNESLRDHVSKIVTFKVPKESVQKIIGSGGKNIKAISEEHSVKIDIDPSCKIYIMGQMQSDVLNAKQAIDLLVSSMPINPEEGKVYDGIVVSIVEFGAFVEVKGISQGLLHISEIAPKRLEDVREVLNEGDKVKVIIKAIDRDNKIKFSMKCVDQVTGEIDHEMIKASTSSGPRFKSSSNFEGRSGGNHRRSDRGGDRKPRRTKPSTGGGGFNSKKYDY